MPSEMVQKCSHALAQKNYTISFIESATAGRMCAEFSMCEDAGSVLKGGIVCYDACVKEELLKVPHHIVDAHTPESAEVTAWLAKGGFACFNTDITVAVTGLTSSGGSENEHKPVGTMFLHIKLSDGAIICKEIFSGSPEKIVLDTIDRVAQLIMHRLSA